MKDEKTRQRILHFLIPILLLIFAIFVIMVNFTINSRKIESERIQAGIRDKMVDNAVSISHPLDIITNCAVTVSAIMAQFTTEDLDIAEAIVQEICRNTDAYMAVLMAPSGDALVDDGTWINLAESPYYDMVRTSEQSYHYVEDDGYYHRSAIVSSIPLHPEKDVCSYLLVFYDIETFDALMNTSDADIRPYIALLDDEGIIIAQTGKIHSGLKEGEDFWKHIVQHAKSTIQRTKINNKIKQNQGGEMYVTVNNKEVAILYQPIGINNWCMVVQIDGSYIDGIIEERLSFTKGILIQMCVAFAIFAVVLGIVVYIEIRRNKDKAQDLQRKADTDELTGLYNKLATERLIKEYMQTHPNDQALLFTLDIDNFKKINDTMGHAFGDEVLSCIGHQLKREFRSSDVVGRTGGDEFMIFLKYIKDEEIMKKEINRVVKIFKDLRVGEYVKYSPTASIGVAVFPRDATEFEKLYKASDHALYQAKKRGKNQIAYYGDDK